MVVKMIKASEVVKAVQERLHELLPDVKYYMNYIPKEFQRPSIAVIRGGMQHYTALSCSVVSWDIDITLIYYAPTNEFYRTDRLGVYDVQDMILNEFAPKKKLRLGDRYLTVEVSAGGEDETAAYINMNVMVTDSCTKENEDDIMQNVNISLTEAAERKEKA